MKKKLLLAMLLGLVLAVAAPAMAQPGSQMAGYQSTPFWLDGQTVPHVMLVLERDWKMFYPAYNNLTDLDGDGALDIGFNPKATYVGYFDHESCYRYEASSSLGNRFVRAGETVPQSDSQAASLAPAIIKSSTLVYPASAHGVCDNSALASGSVANGGGLWHGNWLNFAMTSRIDAIRKVLYGGKRYVDDPDRTVLDMIFVPGNAHVWGGELYSDDLWEEYAPSSPWYDIPSFTGYKRPESKKMHFWARASLYWDNPFASSNAIPQPSDHYTIKESSEPLFRFVANIPSSNLHPMLKTPVRIWDWVGDHTSYGSMPIDGNLAKSKTPTGQPSNGFMYTAKHVSKNFTARVEVCQKGNISPTEGCRAYGANFKPIGLLQEYGESERMFFGLLTGSIQFEVNDSYRKKYNKKNKEGGTRYRGGVVRHHVQPFANYIDTSTGQIKRDSSNKRSGMIPTIDALEITGLDKYYSYVFKIYADGTQAGNPLGEMVWEATRYLAGTGTKPESAGSAYTSAGGLSPNDEYLPKANGNGKETELFDHERKNKFSLPLLRSWDDRPVLGGNANECPKPVILVISEVFPDHDDDDYYRTNDLDDAPLMSFASTSDSEVPPTFHNQMGTYLDLITKYELAEDIGDNRPFFYPSKERGLCTARELKLTDGLKEILGHCPSEPSLEGTYNIAAVAYYAHTHNFAQPLGASDNAEKNIDFYAVGIAGNFPDITMTVDGERSLSLMPITLANLKGSTGVPDGNADNELKTLINFFIEYWLTDDGHEYEEGGKKYTRKVPYKAKFSTNFEFTTTPCYTAEGNSNNLERDLFNTFTISLLTPGDDVKTAEYREDVPLFINSGPFKTDKAKWELDKAEYLATNDKSKFRRQKYYYAFKRPKGKAFDIIGSGFKVVGVAIHSDTFGSGYGSSGLTGYTITGVEHSGPYVDVGLYRADYPLFYTNTSSFVPGPISADEPVPLDPAGSGIPGAKWNWAGGVMHSGYHYTSNGSDCHFYHPPTLRDPLLTPAECPFSGYVGSASDYSMWTDPDLIAAYGSVPPDSNLVCGIQAAGRNPYPSSNSQEINAFRTSLMRYVQVRSFKFNVSSLKSNRPAELRNPLWLAAKYGGFKDHDNNGRPNLDSEWIRGGDGVGASDPYNYFGVANMSELPDQLGKAFEAIANSVGTGTANASSVSQVLGGGISVQTQYRTDYQDGTSKIKWGGTAYAFFMDKWGNLRADTNNNGKLDLVTSPSLAQWSDVREGSPPSPWVEEGDLIVHMVSPSGSGMPTVYLCRDPYGDNNGGNYLPSDPDRHPSGGGYPPYSACELQTQGLDSETVKPLWNAAQKISDMNVDDRRLYTYLGANKANGKNPWPGGVNLKADAFDVTSLDALHKFMEQPAKADTKDLIEYIRGIDKPGKYRNRTVRLPWDAVGTPAKVWRMGDIINSRPVLVGEPSSNFHLTYGDKSYSDYRTANSKRRQVAYFGSNDGILHAVNMGFFGALSDGQAGYSEVPLGGVVPSPNYELGDEIWGYLPPSMLPHLQWLGNEAYQHSYYVDLKPYIVDVKDGNNWRTVMIVGLRLGGAPIELTNGGSEHPYSTPEFFAIDVTDPESPQLMWRFSDASLGQSTALPTVVRSGADDKWYVLLPSGPAQADASGKPIFSQADRLYAGRSTQKARVIVLDVLTGQYARSRDRSLTPPSTPDPLMVAEERSFFNDTFTPRAMNAKTNGSGVTTWGHHVVYLGLSAMGANNYDSGALYRLQMVDASGNPLGVDDWKLTRFYKTDKPVTAASNATYDQVGNLWVLFGTGRIWGKEDMTPCGLVSLPPTCTESYDQYLYGIKEPLDASGRMTFAEVPKDVDILDVSGIKVFENGDLISSLNPPAPLVKDTFEELYFHMLAKTGNQPVVRGYKLRLETWRKDINNKKGGIWVNPSPTVFELINTQIKVDTLANKRVNAVVTSYVPSNNICDPLGDSYLMVYDAFTGLPAPYMVEYGRAIDGETKTVTNPDGTTTTYNEVTVSKKVGAGMASEAWILKTDGGTGGTTYGATGFAGQRATFHVPPGQSENSRFISWREVLDMGFDLKESDKKLFIDLTTP